MGVGEIQKGEETYFSMLDWSRYPANEIIAIGYLGSIPRDSRHFVPE